MKDAASMPPNTGVPTSRRASCEGPRAMTRGSNPRMNAKEVIITGRNRSLAPSAAASRSRATLHSNGQSVVVTDQRLGADDRPHLDEAAQRNHLPIVAAHIDPIDIINRGTVGRLGLDLHLPYAAKQVQVVYVVAAQR